MMEMNNPLYFFNDQYDDLIIQDKIHSFFNSLWYRSPMVQEIVQKMDTVYGTMKDFIIDHNLAFDLKLPSACYICEIPRNLIPYFNIKRFIANYGYNKPIMLDEIVRNHNMFYNRIKFTVGHNVFFKLRMLATRNNTTILALYFENVRSGAPTNGEIDKQWIQDAREKDLPWSLSYELQSDTYCSLQSINNMFEGNTIPMTKFNVGDSNSYIHEFDKESYPNYIKGNEGNICITDDNNRLDVLAQSTCKLITGPDGNKYFEVSEKFKNYIQKNTGNCKCYIFMNDAAIYSKIYEEGIVLDNKLQFQIPITRDNIINPKDAIIHGYDTKNDIMLDRKNVEMGLDYPNIYSMHIGDNIRPSPILEKLETSVLLNEITDVSFSPNGEYLAYVDRTTSPYLYIWKQTTPNSFIVLNNTPILPSDKVKDCEFSPCGNYLTISYTDDTDMEIYKNHFDDTFTKLNNPLQLSMPGYGVVDFAWSTDEKYLVVGTTKEIANFHITENDLFNKLPIITNYPIGTSSEYWSYALNFSGEYLVIGKRNENKIEIFRKSQSNNFRKVTEITHPGVVGVSYSPDNKVLLVLSEYAEYATIYKVSSAVLTDQIITKLSELPGIPAGVPILDATWTSNSRFLTITHANTTASFFRKNDDDTFTKLNNLINLPSNGISCSWTLDKNLIAIAYTSAPYLSIFKNKELGLDAVDPLLGEFFLSPLVNTKFDNNLSDFMLFLDAILGTDYIAKLHELYERIEKYEPLKEFVYDYWDYKVHPTFKNIREYNRTKLIDLLRDNPVRYHNLQKDINWKNRKFITTSIKVSDIPGLLDRCIMDTEKFSAYPEDVIMFKKPQAYLEFSNSTGIPRNGSFFLNGKRTIPTAVSTVKSLTYIYFDRDLIDEHTIITVHMPFGSSEWSYQKHQASITFNDDTEIKPFPDSSIFGPISSKDLIYYNIPTNEYLPKSILRYGLTVNKWMIDRIGGETQWIFGDERITLLITSLSEFFRTSEKEFFQLESQSELVFGPEDENETVIEFYKKIKSEKVRLQLTNNAYSGTTIGITNTDYTIIARILSFPEKAAYTFNNFKGDPDPRRWKVYVNGQLLPEKIIGLDEPLYRINTAKKYNDDVSFTLINPFDESLDYTGSGDHFIKLPDPDVIPTGTVNDSVWHPDGDILAVGHALNPLVTLYKKEIDKLIKITNSGIINPGVNTKLISFSPDGELFIIGTIALPYVIIYRRVAGTEQFIELSGTGLELLSIPTSITWSSDGQYVAFGHQNGPNYFSIWNRNGYIFNNIPLPNDPIAMPNTTVNAIAISPDNKYLAIGVASYPSLIIYKFNNGEIGNRVTPTEIPNGTINAIAWHPDSKYIAVGHSGSPYITGYKVEADTFTKMNEPDIYPPSTVTSLKFSNMGGHLLAGSSVFPFLSTYKYVEDTFIKLDNEPDVYPTGAVTSLAWSPDDKIIALGHAGAQYITLYHRDDANTGLLDIIRKEAKINFMINSEIIFEYEHVQDELVCDQLIPKESTILYNLYNGLNLEFFLNDYPTNLLYIIPSFKGSHESKNWKVYINNVLVPESIPEIDVPIYKIMSINSTLRFDFINLDDHMDDKSYKEIMTELFDIEFNEMNTITMIHNIPYDKVLDPTTMKVYLNGYRVPEFYNVNVKGNNCFVINELVDIDETMFGNDIRLTIYSDSRDPECYEYKNLPKDSLLVNDMFDNVYGNDFKMFLSNLYRHPYLPVVPIDYFTIKVLRDPNLMDGHISPLFFNLYNFRPTDPTNWESNKTGYKDKFIVKVMTDKRGMIEFYKIDRGYYYIESAFDINNDSEYVPINKAFFVDTQNEIIELQLIKKP